MMMTLTVIIISVGLYFLLCKLINYYFQKLILKINSYNHLRTKYLVLIIFSIFGICLGHLYILNIYVRGTIFLMSIIICSLSSILIHSHITRDQKNGYFNNLIDFKVLKLIIFGIVTGLILFGGKLSVIFVPFIRLILDLFDITFSSYHLALMDRGIAIEFIQFFKQHPQEQFLIYYADNFLIFILMYGLMMFYGLHYSQ